MIRTLLLLLLVTAPALAQPEPTVRALRLDDGRAFVYHTDLFAPGSGFHVYRDGERVTPDPIYAPRDASELSALLGDSLFAELSSALATREADRIGADTVRALTPYDAFVLLRADPIAGLTYTFLEPDLARALGRLYVDSDPPGGRVTYRFAEVSARGLETGREVSQTLRLERSNLRRPDRLDYEQAGDVVEVTWRYPRNRADDARDFAIAFDVFRLEPDGSRTKLNRRPLLRNALEDRHLFFYEPAPGEQNIRLAVWARDIAQQTGELSEPLAVELVDQQAPGVPPVVNAQVVGERIVVVRWQAPPDADVVGYRVFRQRGMTDDSGLERLHRGLVGADARTFVDSAAVVGTAFYRVQAEDAAGNESPLSSVALAQIADTTPPDSAVALNATPERTPTGWQIALDWTADVPDDFGTFVVSRQIVGLGATEPQRIDQGDLTASRFVDAFPPDAELEGYRIRYSVQVQDTVRNLSAPTSIQVDVPNVTPPPAPSEVDVRTDEDRPFVSWSPSPARDVRAYRIERALDADLFVLVDSVRAGRSSWTDYDTSTGDSSRYRVTAVDAAGLTGVSNPVAWVKSDRQAPPRVRNVRARAADVGVRVTWEPVASRDLAGYVVLRAERGAGVFVRIGEVGDATDWVDRGGSIGQFYRVVAVDRSGNESALSEPVQAIRARAGGSR